MRGYGCGWEVLAILALLGGGCAPFELRLASDATSVKAARDTDATLAPAPIAAPLATPRIVNAAQHSFTTDGADFDPDLSPDGGLLAFASTRNSPSADIFVKKPTVRTMMQLTDDPAADVQPSFSPDGQRIAFASNRAGNWDIWLVRADGTHLQQLSDERGDEMAPAWSPSGRQIACTLWNRAGRQWEIWLLDLDQPGARSFLTHGMFPSWSPDGTKLAFQRPRQRGSRQYSIWTVDLIEGEARHPTQIAAEDAAACMTPTWSPDGGQILYAAAPLTQAPNQPDRMTPQTADLWVVDVESGERRKLTPGVFAAFNPCWTSDGRIYFVAHGDGRENIWSIAAPAGTGTAPGESQSVAPSNSADDPDA